MNLRLPVAIAFFITLLLALYLGLSSHSFKHDKLLHVSIFFILTTEFYFLFDTKNKSLKLIKYCTFFVCTLFGSIFSEVIQNLINPKRVFDIYDIIANIGGSLAGLFTATLMNSWNNKRMRKMRTHSRTDSRTDGVMFDNPTEDSLTTPNQGDDIFELNNIDKSPV